MLTLRFNIWGIVRSMRDEVLAARMGLNIKDLLKVTHPLVQQRLLAVLVS